MVIEFGDQLSNDFEEYCLVGIPTRVLSTYLSAIESLSGISCGHHGQQQQQFITRLLTRLLKAIIILGEQSVQYSQQMIQIVFKIW